MSKDKSPDHVFFSPGQLQYLENLFPHVVQPHTAPEAALRHYFGSQAVLEAVRRKTRGLSPRITAVGLNDIPSPR